MTAFGDYSKTLVVLERDSDWPDWLQPLQFAGGRVIAQTELESPGRLAQRVRRTVEYTALAGEPLKAAILGCNDRFDERAFRARTEIVHTLLAALQHSPSACLRLTASARHSGRSHHALSEFARGLAERWEGHGIQVSARFGGHGATRLSSQLGPLGDVLRVA